MEAIEVTVPLPLDRAEAVVRAGLAEHGFGVLTEIDIKATLKNKLDEDMENYLILGACNPPLAHQALGVHRQIGLLLPCNVVVRSDPDDPDTTLIEAMNPQLLVDVTDDPGLKPVAEEVGSKLKAVIDALRT